MSKPFLVVNPRAGDQSPTAAELKAEAERTGIEAHALAAGEDPAELAARAASAGAAALGVAGGDGSLGPVAAVAVDQEIPFVCVPFGTRNHFARDLGLDPDDPLAALAAFRGRERAVDVGTVDGRTFVNNVSLGIYASFVHDPRRKTRNRVLAGLRMAPAALGRGRRPLRLSFELEGRREEHAALVVLVANNGYDLRSLADLGERTRLDEGLLHAYVIEAVSRRTLLGLLLRTAAGAAERADGLVERQAMRFRLQADRARTHAAIDGEPAVLGSPLEFEVRPRALRVLLPAP
ncbi:MAG TPA: diacylglycerol kinase family protein [Gaiellaceae bacterium]|nr:diacylglycerol kinase family protein [Gaiellaceae bacterium]